MLTHGVKSDVTSSKFDVSVGLETSGLYGASTKFRGLLVY